MEITCVPISLVSRHSYMTVAGEAMPNVVGSVAVPGKHLQPLAAKPRPARLSERFLIILRALAQSPACCLSFSWSPHSTDRPVGLNVP